MQFDNAVDFCDIKTKEDVDEKTKMILSKLPSSHLNSFLRKISFYINHIDMVNRKINSYDYDKQLFFLKNLKNVIEVEVEHRETSVARVGKYYQNF